MKLLFTLVALVIVQFCGAQTNKPIVYYVGNMGVAIAHHDSVILIDALHDYYDVYYLPTDSLILTKLKQSLKPFHRLVAITATHMHNDHFDGALIEDVSRTMIKPTVVMGKQPAGQLTKLNQAHIKSIDQEGVVRLNSNLTIAMKNVGHTGTRHQSIENYRIEITWGSYRFIHFGDASPDARIMDGIADGADVAIVPYWFCFDSKDIQLMESKKFKMVIATHIEPKGVAPFSQSTVTITPFHSYGQFVEVK